MSYTMPATPQRALPGAYLQTPAVTRQPSGQLFQQRPPSFRLSSTANVPDKAQTPQSHAMAQHAVPAALPSPQPLTPIERAADTIDKALLQQKRYPDLDQCVQQGKSADYDIPTNPAWAPYQKVKTYKLPDKILDQYNRAEVSTMLGLFAELNHAWVAIDNALYLWDYTHPNPELIGYEEQYSSITAVKLVRPRAKVFVDTIQYLLVVATTSDIQLLGVSCEAGSEGIHSVQLYQTKMSIPVRGLDVNCVEGSDSTGRIFFGGRSSDDVYEFTYQQEEGWFANRCAKINHVNKSMASLLPTLSFGRKEQTEYIVQMAADDSRRLLYTLSSRGSIRVFHIGRDKELAGLLTISLHSIRTHLSHISAGSQLLGSRMTIASISPIPAAESSLLSLMATTNTGCRIYFSATPGASSSDLSARPSSMQVHHIKFPPPEVANNSANPQMIDENSLQLKYTEKAVRYPPGYFFAFVRKPENPADHLLFLSAPDAGRIAQPQEAIGQPLRLLESAHWINLGGIAEGIGLTTEPFAASASPTGFGNELAVQYDRPTTEIAILTNSGVHTIRRRRLVDQFAGAIRAGASSEAFEDEVRRFVRRYGRPEVAATSLAVACGQGSDVTPDSRVAYITDKEVTDYARKVFIEFGGKATWNENSLVDQRVSAVDTVRPSPRHDGIALYISRLVRSAWDVPIIKEAMSPVGGLTAAPSVPIAKLRQIQHDLTHLQEFLDDNKSFIDGLGGPEMLRGVATKKDELALQGESRALHSLVVLISSIIEGIAFILTLFDEQVSEILLTLTEDTRQRVRSLTYKGLFTSPDGKELAKELVKSIVQRNIAKGSNVDTVAEALRRRCGSFCSADDVVIFKAQELINKAAEAGAASGTSRQLLNDSLALFEKVAASLKMEQLQWVVSMYTELDFYAGAVKLALQVAHERDRGNRALAWLRDGSPAQDPRQEAHEERTRCYDLIQEVVKRVDEVASQGPEMIDGQLSPTAKYRSETYGVINDSDDEVFQNHLYDWYLSQGWSDRLLQIQSPYVVPYLQRKSDVDVGHADLLWKYHAHYHRYLEAALVQLELAKSDLELPLTARIEYLSRAKASASTRVGGIGEMRMSRQARQELVREITDHLDLANIQLDILHRMHNDPRIAPDDQPEVDRRLNGKILPLQELFTSYADEGGYYDLCLLIYEVADHRNPTDIQLTWANYIDQVHNEETDLTASQPYERVANRVRELGRKLNVSETTFPIPFLLPSLLEYYCRFADKNPTQPLTWPLDVFLDLNVPPEQLFGTLEAILYDQRRPFDGKNRRLVAEWLVYVAERWSKQCMADGDFPYGGEEAAVGVAEVLRGLIAASLLGPESLERVRTLRAEVDSALRG